MPRDVGQGSEQDSRSGPSHTSTASSAEDTAVGRGWAARPATRDEWNDVLASAPEPTIAQTPLWLDAILAVHGGRDATRIYQTDDGRRLILPLVARGPRRHLSVCRSLPYGWGNPWLVSGGPAGLEDVRMVFIDLASLEASHVGVRTSGLPEEAYDVVPDEFTWIPHTTHSVDLSRGFDHFWDTTLTGATRTKIRKAEKSRVAITRGRGGELLSQFYDMYDRWTIERARRRNIPPRIALATAHRRDPRRKFEVVANALGDQFVVWVASLDGAPIAADIQLFHGVHSTYWRGYGLRGEAGRTRATWLLQTCMIEEACRRGCRRHHMGESGGVASLVHFKTTFGAEPTTYREYYRERLPFMGLARTLDRAQSAAERSLVKLRRRS